MPPDLGEITQRAHLLEFVLSFCCFGGHLARVRFVIREFRRILGSFCHWRKEGRSRSLAPPPHVSGSFCKSPATGVTLLFSNVKDLALIGAVPQQYRRWGEVKVSSYGKENADLISGHPVAN